MPPINGGWLGVNNGGTAVLDGSTSQGAITISPGSTWTSGNGSNTYVQGTFNNQGNIQINGGNGQNTNFELNGNTTLQGGGTMTLWTIVRPSWTVPRTSPPDTSAPSAATGTNGHSLSRSSADATVPRSM